MAGHRIIPLEQRHRDSAAEALSLAFIEDPILVHVTPYRARREKWANWWWRTTIGYGMRWGVAETDETALFAIASGIIVTVIYVIGLVVRSRRTIGRIGIDSVLVMAIYLATLAVFYSLR